MRQQFNEILIWIQGCGPLASVMFVLFYIAASILLIPGSLLNMAAGVLFGLLWGSVLVSISAVLGAASSFLIARYFLRKLVRKNLEKNEKFKALDNAVLVNQWKIVILTRLSPIMPYNILNYVLGFTSVDFKSFFFASWIGMLPGILVYVYLGSLVSKIVLLEDYQTKSPLELVFYGLGFIMTVLVTIYITFMARKALTSRRC